MATDVIRVYFVVNAGTLNPTENQWKALFNRAKTKPLSAAIVAAATAAQNFICVSKRSMGAGFVLKNTLCGFEIDYRTADDLLAVLNAQADLRGVTGTIRQKFEGVLQAELRESAVDLGFSQANANQISIVTVGYGGRFSAIDSVQQYITLNAAMWVSVG